MFSVIIYFLIYLNVTDRLLLNLQVIISSQKSAQQVHMDVLAVPGPIVSHNLGRPLFGLCIDLRSVLAHTNRADAAAI